MRNIEEIIERIKEVYGVKKDIELKEAAHIKPNTLSTWKERASIPYKKLDEISQNENISMDWLLSGYDNVITLTAEEHKGLVSIPYYEDTYAAAGFGTHNGDVAPSVMSFDQDFLRKQLGINTFTGLHIITAIGDSMIPTLVSGELLFVLPFRSEDNIIHDNGIYVIQTPNGTMVKRIEPHPINKSYILRSDNSRIDPIKLEGDEIDACKIIGRVVAHFDRV